MNRWEAAMAFSGEVLTQKEAANEGKGELALATWSMAHLVSMGLHWGKALTEAR